MLARPTEDVAEHHSLIQGSLWRDRPISCAIHSLRLPDASAAGQRLEPLIDENPAAAMWFLVGIARPRQATGEVGGQPRGLRKARRPERGLKNHK